MLEEVIASLAGKFEEVKESLTLKLEKLSQEIE